MTLSRSRRRPPARAARSAERGSGPLPWILLALCAAWAVPATYLAVTQYGAVVRLTDEAAIRQAEHEGKIRALTRRLVGVASHQMLEQDGLAERLADIIVRQVDLENREAALAATLERALASGVAPQPEPPGRVEEPARQPPARKGAAVERSFAGKPLREQFEQIETRLGRTEGRQFRLAERFTVFARERIERVRAVLADLHLALTPGPAAAPPGPAPRDAFGRALAAADASLAEAGRWRSLGDTIPVRSPIEGDSSTSSNFGLRKDPFTGERRMHAGMDFRSPVGTLVRTAGNGRVVTASQSGGYGNLVEIDHGHDLVTRYAHLSSIGVSVGQAVPAGTVVGAVGSTGRSTGPHLHYETRLSGSAVDPGRFLAAGAKLLGAPARTEAPPDPDAVESAD